MVYRGKPSTGCLTCRSRHIKCDETRPHCKACVRTGRECPGYPHPLDIMLRDRIAFHRKKGKASSSTTAISVNNDQKIATNDPKATTVTPVSSIPPKKRRSSAGVFTFVPQVPDNFYLPMEDTVISLFFNSYLYLPKDPLVRIGFMELLPQTYANSKIDSAVRLSALAVAFFSVAAWTGQQRLLDSARQSFVKALSRTREALQGDIDQNLDDILITVLLLSTYEEFSALKNKQRPPKAHLRGAIALIDNCSPERRNTARSKTLISALQNQIIKSSMGGTVPIIETPGTWPLSHPIPQLASSQLSMTTAEVVSLRQRWARFSDQLDSPNLEEAKAIMARAQHLDCQLAAWGNALPQHWLPVQANYIPQSVQDAGIYLDRCDCYTDFWIAATWNSNRDSRIALYKIILDCLKLLPNRSNEIQTTLSVIHALATDICATIPFYLGSQTGLTRMISSQVEYPKAETRRTSTAHQQTAPLLGGWFLLTPLQNLSLLECLPEAQMNWIKEQKQRVLRIYTFNIL